MKLYNMNLSNFATKSRIVVYEKGANVELAPIPGLEQRLDPLRDDEPAGEQHERSVSELVLSAELFDYPIMARALILGDKDTVARKTREGLDLSMDPKDLIFKGLIPGMDVVGEKFRRNEYYVPQVLLFARAMYAGLDLLKPLITAAANASD